MSIHGNFIPENVKTIHLTAACGTAMGALACLLKELGFKVTGSDQKVYPPMSTFLEEKGIMLFEGFSEKNLTYHPDLVVVGNAVTKTNPEALALQSLGLNYCSMPQAINHFIASGKKTILVTGTHGKTTTSSIMAWILDVAGFNPSFVIGGILKNYNSNYRLGNGPYIVIEGDEYDTAFFDKGPKFLHYDPFATIITSIEFDHADIFRDLSHVKQAFSSLIARLSPESSLITYADDPNIKKLLKNPHPGGESYGKSSSANWRFDHIHMDPEQSTFSAYYNGIFFGKFDTFLIGEHNLLNALAVMAVCRRLGINLESIQKGLKTFGGVKRRQEIRGAVNDIVVMDDFAHHPTAVRETLEAVRKKYSDRRLVAVFEPRTNTSMRNVFQEVYPTVFDPADLICIRKPPLLEKIPEPERFSSLRLVTKLKERGKEAQYFEDTDSIIHFIIKTAKPGDLILIMSNGGFDNIHERLLEGFRNQVSANRLAMSLSMT
jgi:UDP-N-acetylmuramate: L-alanyl-gamma-D-glutamyl-meso-diaminopimelate ligase